VVPHLLGELFNDLLDQIALIMITQQVGDLVGQPSPIAFGIFGTKPPLFDFRPSGLKSALGSGESAGSWSNENGIDRHYKSVPVSHNTWPEYGA
jgi:hypothetical protein